MSWTEITGEANPPQRCFAGGYEGSMWTWSSDAHLTPSGWVYGMSGKPIRHAVTHFAPYAAPPPPPPPKPPTLLEAVKAYLAVSSLSTSIDHTLYWRLRDVLEATIAREEES